MAMDVYKITLSSGKEVILKKMLIKHNEQAALSVADKGGENPLVFSMLMQKELLKLLIHSINGKELKDAEKQSLDDILDVEEYYQVMSVMGKLTGNEKAAKPQVTMIKSGE